MTTGHDASDASARVQTVVKQLEEVQGEAEKDMPPPEADGVASFNFLYTTITTAILTRLQNNSFKDPQFLSELDVQFAQRYLNALAEFQQKSGSAPRAWRVLFDKRRNPRITRMQFAVAGVNAHVNFDLAFALVATWEPAGPPASASPQHDDYLAINQVFSDEMDRLRHHFEDSLLQSLDKSTADRINNYLDDMVVVVSRNNAWHAAEHLWRLKGESAEEFRLRSESMDIMTALAGEAVLAPVDIGGLPPLPARAGRGDRHRPVTVSSPVVSIRTGPGGALAMRRSATAFARPRHKSDRD